ncbi:MAG TPA: CrcB family protein [Mycobacteriales bacterium]|nr:CrcB family protein [Mycobacteriales bacterium]
MGQSGRGVLLAVFVGGCAGGAARDALDGSSARLLLINLAGCLLLGLLVVTVPHHWRALLGTGFCGAFTTFGTVSVLVEHDLEDGRSGTGLGYLSASLLGGVAAAALGVALGHVLSHRRELAPEDPDLEVD